MTDHEQEHPEDPGDDGLSEGVPTPEEASGGGGDDPGLNPPASPGARSGRARGEGDEEPSSGEGGAEENGSLAEGGDERGWSPKQMELADTLSQEPIAPRAYYSIGEVCDLTGLKPHVLRYWESQFEVMNPTKNRAGNRVYRPKDIDLVFLVRRLLYEEKYTIEGARKRLLEMRHEGALDDEKQEVLGPEFLAEIKRELLGLRALLTAPEPEE
jgi:DNA-binding transcriptional MerR regulator